MKPALELLLSVPSTFWGVLAGSIFTIVGVALTNRASDRRQAREFAHAMKLKADQQTSDIRREVYLAAAEAYAIALQCVGKLADPDGDDSQAMKLWVERSPAIWKANVVAGPVLMSESLAFFSEMSGRCALLGGKRVAYRSLRAVEAACNEAEKVSRRNSANEAGYEIMRLAMESQARLAAMYIPILVEFRKELGLPADAAEIERSMSSSVGARIRINEALNQMNLGPDVPRPL